MTPEMLTAEMLTAEALTPELFARLACEQPMITFTAAYDSRGVTLTDLAWYRWLSPTAGPTATILVVETARQLATAATWTLSPKLLAALLGVGRSRLTVAIARAIRYRILYPMPDGTLGLDLCPPPPIHPMDWPTTPGSGNATE